MIPSDKRSFDIVWQRAMAIYDKRPSDAAIDMAFCALSSLTIEQVRQGLTAHVRDPKDGRFFPKPADIIRHIEGDGDSRALAAWSQVEQAIRRIGPYESVVFDQPQTMRVIQDMGGWIQLCECSEKDMPFKQSEFVKRFAAELSSANKKDFPAKLCGITELTNSGNHGDFVPEPRLIGDARRCLQILDRGKDKSTSMISLSQARNIIAGRLRGADSVLLGGGL